jgi:IS30 family transposase
MKVRFPTESSIDDRPAILEEKKRIGDSEVDLMMGCKSGGGLLTLMDRNTR